MRIVVQAYYLIQIHIVKYYGYLTMVYLMLIPQEYL